MVEREVHRTHNVDGFRREDVGEFSKEITAHTDGLDVFHLAEDAIGIDGEGRQTVVVEVELNGTNLGAECLGDCIYAVVRKVKKTNLFHLADGSSVKGLHLALVQIQNLD